MKLVARMVHRHAPATMWETLRIIRNSCIDGLTGTRREVGIADQVMYRLGYDVERVRHYLFYDGDRPVAFARIEMSKDFATCAPSLGVAKWERGKGYGREVARQTLMMAGAHMTGEILLSNAVIQHIDYSLGWHPVGDPQGDVQPAECSWPPPFTEPQSQQAALDEIVRYHASSGDGLA